MLFCNSNCGNITWNDLSGRTTRYFGERSELVISESNYICWKGGGMGEPWFPLFCSEDFNAFGESESKTVRPPAVGGEAAVSVFDYILPKDFIICKKTQNLPNFVPLTVPKNLKSW